MKKEITKIDGNSVAKIVGITYAILGLAFGIFMVILSIMGNGGLFAVVVVLLIIPTLYGVVGYLASLLGVTIYNMIAKKVGGIVFYTQETVSSTADTQ